MVKKVKIMRLCNFSKNHSDLNFHPIFKNLVSKCLAVYLLKNKLIKNIYGSKMDLNLQKWLKK